MNKGLFDELVRSMRQMDAITRGTASPSRTFKVFAPEPPHLPRAQPGAVLRFWIVLAAMLAVDGSAVWAVAVLVRWVKGLFT